jgi:hypothetical protein
MPVYNVCNYHYFLSIQSYRICMLQIELPFFIIRLHDMFLDMLVSVSTGLNSSPFFLSYCGSINLRWLWVRWEEQT